MECRSDSRHMDRVQTETVDTEKETVYTGAEVRQIW